MPRSAAVPKARAPTLVNLQRAKRGQYPGIVGDSWHGIFAPKGTPEPVLALLLATSQQVMANPDFRAKLVEYGLTPVGDGPQAFRRFLEEDARACEKVVRENQITAQ